MDRRRKTIPEGKLSGISYKKTCKVASSDTESDSTHAVSTEFTEEKTLSESQKSPGHFRVGKVRKNHRWKLSELNFIRENMNKMTNVELAKYLGLKTHQVSSYMCNNKIKRTTILYAVRKDCAENPNWSQDEIEYVQRFYPEFTADTIAEKLNRTPNSIYKMARNLGLKKNLKWL